MELTVQAILDRLDRMSSYDGRVRAVIGKPGDPMATGEMINLALDVHQVGQLLGRRLRAAAAYLQRSQEPDGHWWRPDDDWHTSITAWSALALARSGFRASESCRCGIAWLGARQRADGGMAQSETERAANSYATAFAAAALFAVDGFGETLSRALEWLSSHQSIGGGFGDTCEGSDQPEASLTAYVAHALSYMRMGQAPTIIKGCQRFLATSQRSNGAWSSWFEDRDSIEGTAACVRVLAWDCAAFGHHVEAGLRYLSNALPYTDVDDWMVITLGQLIPLIRSH
jgi:squalene cyclase